MQYVKEEVVDGFEMVAVGDTITIKYLSEGRPISTIIYRNVTGAETVRNELMKATLHNYMNSGSQVISLNTIIANVASILLPTC